MFYIVESEAQLTTLHNIARLGCFVEVISSNDYYHPKLTSVSAVYIKCLHTGNGYIVPINHTEGINVEYQRVKEILTNAEKVYTLDKKKLLYHFNIQNAIDISLLYSMVKFDRLEVTRGNNSINFYYNRFAEKTDLNSIVPISILYDSCEKLFDSVKHVLDFDIPQGFDFYNKTTLVSKVASGSRYPCLTSGCAAMCITTSGSAALIAVLRSSTFLMSPRVDFASLGSRESSSKKLLAVTGARAYP